MALLVAGVISFRPLTIISPPTCSGAPPGQDELDVKTFVSLWKSQESEIATAYIRCRTFRRAGNDLTTHSRQQLNDAIESFDLVAQPNELKHLVNKLLTTPIASERPWSMVQCFFQGSRSREDVDNDTSTPDTQVFDGQMKLEFSNANKHVALFPPGASQRAQRTLRDFRFVPNPEGGPYVVAARSGAQVTLRQGLSELVVDAVTGVLYRYVMRSDTGAVWHQIIQDGHVIHPGDIVFPSLRVDAAYLPDGRVGFLAMAIVEEAQFNTELPEDVFAVAVPAQTNVLDERVSGHRRAFPVLEAVPDVVKHVNSQIDVNTRQQEAGTRWWFVSILLVSAAILVLWPAWKRWKRASLS